MATLTQLPSGHWRVQVRLKGQYSSKTFILKAEAENWAQEQELLIKAGINSQSVEEFKSLDKFAALINLHISDLAEVGRAPRRSKAYALELLSKNLGNVKLDDLGRERLISYGRWRAKHGAGAVTLNIEFGYIKLVLIHAASVHGLEVNFSAIDQARQALKHLGLLSHSKERDRRPTLEELNAIFDAADSNPRQIIPLSRIVRFAIATAMRQDEICRLDWRDIDMNARTAVIRNRKDPKKKKDNDQKIPLISAAGFDPIALLVEQKSETSHLSRAFPYNGRSVGTAFRRICRRLNIQDLRFHDLRHEAASRFFEAGLKIEEVALITGHKDWKMLQRYTHLKPEQLVRKTDQKDPIIGYKR